MAEMPTVLSPNDLEPIERASRDEIAALQLQRLQWTLRHTYDNVKTFRDKCIAVGVHPDDMKTLPDLAKFPFMTKTDLRDHYPFGLFAVPREQLARLHASSGTTGKPVVAGYTKQDLANWAQVVARSLRAAGVRAGDMVHNAYTPVMEIDAQTYAVRADGQLLTCEPASVLPMAQRYFLF